MPLFIDGYNLIHAARNRRLSGYDLVRGETEPARDHLLDLLAKYRAARTDKIIVYFDGGSDADRLPGHAMERGMDIRFSSADSDADTDIKNAVSRHDNPRAVRVITSDVAIQKFVRRYGAQVTGSGDFLDEIFDALEDHAIPDNEPIEKYEGPSSNDETEYWLGVFGEAPEDDDA